MDRSKVKMKAFGHSVLIGAAVLCLGVKLSAQVPVAYTMTTAAGGAAEVCSGAADALGNGCPATQAIINTNVQAVTADPEGNILIADTGNSMIRKVNLRTGLITVVAGSVKTSVCAAALDRYGDGCIASDGLANAAGGYTSLGKLAGIAVAKNGDIYFTGGISLVQKISAATGVMSVVAGSTSPAGHTGSALPSGYSGDNGAATSAQLSIPRGVAVDSDGNVYIADTANNVIRKVTASTGIITTIAGSTSKATGNTGDNGPAASALLSGPNDIAVDDYGNIFIADAGNARIRVIYNGGPTFGLSAPVPGYIYRIAGGGPTSGQSTPYLLGTSAFVSTPRKIALDRHGNLYIADNTQLIWFMDAATGFMRPIAGVYNGTAPAPGCPEQTDTLGDGCPALQAIFLRGSAYGVGVDPFGNVLITDPGNLRIRKVTVNTAFPATTPNAPVTQTMQLHYGSGNTPATTNAFTSSNPDYAVVGAPACVTNSDSTSDCTLQVTFTPSLPGTENAALFANGSLGAGSVGLTGVGSVPALGLDPGVATAVGSGLKMPQGAVSDGSGHILVADTGNHRVLEYDATTLAQTVIAGTGTSGYSGDDGAATSAQLNAPQGVGVGADGSIYIADTGNNVVRRIDPTSKRISTIAGGSASCAAAFNEHGDGCMATQASLAAPASVAVDGFGNIFVADTGNNVVREINLNGFISTVAGGSAACSSASDALGNGCPATQAILSAPSQLLFNQAGDLYLADTGHNMVRRVSLSSVEPTITAIAGNGQAGGGGDGGAALSAQLNAPASIALDGAGSLYIADTGSQSVRVVSSASGTISTIAGINGSSGAGTLPGTANQILLNGPSGVAVSGAGDLYVMDTANNRAMIINRSAAAIDFGSVNLTESSPVQGVSVSATGTVTTTLGSPLTTSTGDTGNFSFAAATTQGCSSAEALVPGESCLFSAQFLPVVSGALSATYTLAGGTAVNAAPAILLSGTGAQLTRTTTVLAQTTPASGNPQYGQTAVVTVTVAPEQVTSSPMSGTVTLQIDGIAQAPVTLGQNGSTSIPLPILSVGVHALVAVYSGDSNYGGSTSQPFQVTVAKASTNTVVVSAPTGTIQFQSVTFTATVSATTSGIPTGTVSFMSGGTVLGTGTLSAQGVATFTTANLAVATYQIVATYSGDTNYVESSSPVLQFVVSPDPPDFSLSASSTSVTTGQGGTGQTTITITPTNTLNGTVTFSCTGLPSNSVCTFLPSQVVFTPAKDVPTQVVVSLWTNVSTDRLPPATAAVRRNVSTLLALLLPVGMMSFFRRRSVVTRAVLGLCLLIGMMAGLSGCGNSLSSAGAITPPGKSTVSIQAKGPDGQSHVLPITFTVNGN